MPSPAELFIVGFHGPRLPEALARRFGRGDFAGLIFFRRNFTAPDDAMAIGDDLEAVMSGYVPDPERRLPPPILAIDHEGGRVQRLRGQVTVWPPMMNLADKPPKLAESVGRAMAWELAGCGFNVSFAPVLDVHTNPANPIIGDRAFGTDPDAAATRALAYLRGLESEPGLRGCGKHFPGHGDTETDSHLTLPTVRRDLETLKAVELLPFQRSIAARIGMLMTAHVVYPAVDERPATLSRTWLHDILRTQLGYDGLVVSDDLDMKAVTAGQLGIPDDSGVVVESLLAGCDAFLFCQEPERLQRAEEALIRAAENSSTVRDRIAESAARLQRFRSSLGGGRPIRERLQKFPVPEHLRLREQFLR